MTAPQINTLEYLRRALSDQQNSAVVTQNADGSLSMSVDIGPGKAEIELEPLQGATGAPGLPQFPLVLMPDIYTDPKDLPFVLTDTGADIGKFWLIDQSDENGCINSAAYIWFGTEYRVLPFGVQGPPGQYGVIKPYVTLLEPNNTSHMEWTGSGTTADPYQLTLDLSIPQGPMGESCPLFKMPDIDHSRPPTAGQLMAYTGNNISHEGDSLPLWGPASVGDIIPQPYIIPSSAFSSYSNIDFSKPVAIANFSIPPCPFPWKPLVWGQIEMYGTSTNTWFVTPPSQIGIIVLLGDPDPEVGTLIARGFGNAPRGVVTVFPHCSYPQHPAGPGEPAGVAGSDSLAMTPWNDLGAVSANNTGNESTIYVILVNEGKKYGQRVRFDFEAAGSSLFVMACPMTDQDQLSPPLYGGLTTRTKLAGLVIPTPPAPMHGAQSAQFTLPNPGSRTYPLLRTIRLAKQPPTRYRRSDTDGLERGGSPSIAIPNQKNPAWPVLRPIRRARKV